MAIALNALCWAYVGGGMAQAVIGLYGRGQGRMQAVGVVIALVFGLLLSVAIPAWLHRRGRVAASFACLGLGILTVFRASGV